MLVIVAGLLSISCNNVPVPPKAKILPTKKVIHNTEIIDNYAWLKDKTRSNKEVLDYLRAENKYCEQKLKHTAKMQKKIFNKMKERVHKDEISVPVQIGEYLYYHRVAGDKEYPLYCRKALDAGSVEEIYFDVNMYAQNHSYFDVDELSVSPNHQYLVFSADTNGSENYTMHLLDITSDKLLEEEIIDSDDFVWASDSKTFFYSTVNSALRSDKVFKHVLGTNVSDDKLIYEEKDEGFYVWLSKTRSERFIILGTANNTTSEIRYLPAAKPNNEFTLFQKREQNVEYYIQDHEEDFFITTNADGCENFTVQRVNMADTGKKYRKTYIAHNDSISVSISTFKDFILIKNRINGLIEYKIQYFTNEEDSLIEMPDEVYTISQYANPDYNTKTLTFSYESMTNPEAILQFDTKTQKLTVLKEVAVNDYNKTEYQTKRICVSARDGSHIPVSLVYKKDMFKENAPLWLYAYGSYGESEEPYFNPSAVCLLNRGFVYAIAHVRGGGELGSKWHKSGKMLNKKNTFTDFIDCAEYLIEEKYTTSEKLVIEGGSAGGLLVGAVVNMRPELFKAAVADVPFVSLINTMMDPSLSATVAEYEEWGNPKKKEYFEYMISYCPYRNIVEQEYPAMMITAGFNDPRVNYWEPAKWVAKLRVNKTDDNLLLLYTNMEAGHAGSSGRFNYLKETARTYAFVFDVLGISE